MNAVTSFVAIASLLLALATAGAGANKQKDVNSPAASRNITPSKLGLNHNETMVSDAALVQQADTLSEWLMNVQTSILTRFSIYLSGRCEDWGCGTNHNETFLQDAAATPQAADRRLLTTGEQAAAFAAGLLIKFFTYLPTGGRCEEWGCGSNHNETMVLDGTLVQQADSLTQWLTNLQDPVLTRSSIYLSARCEDWGCGMNHNETLVRDVAR